MAPFSFIENTQKNHYYPPHMSLQ
ncbi:MAG: hypothetical protein RL411_1285, partial [Bacteroidota bacterium]